jgi:hypothetical protein
MGAALVKSGMPIEKMYPRDESGISSPDDSESCSESVAHSHSSPLISPDFLGQVPSPFKEMGKWTRKMNEQLPERLAAGWTPEDIAIDMGLSDGRVKARLAWGKSIASE